ncbi:MAG: alpha-amylase family glycosyl hydrolase [Actinomycetaceae bacterium]|nr:alpha-amylase family glycosyl hydrolase [Actinomycetaceae bacterium]
MSSFSDHAITWQVFPLGALGAPTTNPLLEGGDIAPERTLADLVPWLDHALKLGTNAVLLGPIFQSFSHGYDTVDYFTIDSRLGSRADFDIFVAAAHQRGIRVILDGVFNHLGSRHPFLQELVNGPQAEHADFFQVNWEGWTAGELPSYHCFEGHTGLATLNHDNPRVQQYITDVMNYWLAAGADGWRLDAAYAMNPHTWSTIVPRVREKFPDVWIVGEVIHGDYAQMVLDSGWDSLTQYELWKSIWSSLNDQNFYELDWNLRRHSQWCATFLPLTFIGNHDVTRIATQLETIDDVGLAVAVLLTVPGIPSIYYGDELGFEGLKEERLGGDDAIRQSLPTDTRGATDSPQAARFWHWYASLIALRRQHPWLQRGLIDIEYLENTVIRYRVSDPNSEATLTVVLNCADEPIASDHAALANLGPAIAGQRDDGKLRAHAYLIA